MAESDSDLGPPGWAPVSESDDDLGPAGWRQDVGAPQLLPTSTPWSAEEWWGTLTPTFAEEDHALDIRNIVQRKALDIPVVQDQSHVFASFMGESSSPCQTMVATKKVEAAVHNIDAKSMDRHLALAAQAVLVCSRWFIALLFLEVARLVTQEHWVALTLLIRLLIDETSFTVRSRDKVQTPESAEQLAIVPHAHLPHVGKAKHQTQVNKIYQSEVLFAMHLRTPLGLLLCLTFLLPVRLCTADRSTAEVLNAVVKYLLSLPGLEYLKGLFKNVVDMTTMDRAGSNLRWDRFLSRVDTMSRRLTITCFQHRTAGCMTRVFDLVKSLLTCLIRLSLGLRPAGALAKLREVLQVYITDRLRVYRGRMPPGPETPAGRHRDAVLRLFLSRPPTHIAKQLILIWRTLASGGCSVHGIVEHYCPPGCCASEEETLFKFITFWIPAVLRKGLKLFARNRWTGSDQTLSTGGLLCANSMLQDVIPVWAKYCASPAYKLSASSFPAPPKQHVAPGDDCRAPGWVVPYAGPARERCNHRDSFEIHGCLRTLGRTVQTWIGLPGTLACVLQPFC